MSLKKCKECNTEISSSAKTCPNCGKEQRNIIQKHPIIFTIIILIIIGRIGTQTTINQYNKNKINITSNSNSISADDLLEKEKQVSLGDKITGKDWEIILESAQFSQKVEPPKKNTYYTYYQVDDSNNTYMYIILDCKNISTLDLKANSVATVTVKYNNKYTYSSYSIVPDNTLGFRYPELRNIKPLTSDKIYFLAEMPKTIAEETDTPVEIYIKFENQTYICKYR